MQPEGPATDARTARTFHVSVGADAAQISARKGIPYGLRTPRRSAASLALASVRLSPPIRRARGFSGSSRTRIMPATLCRAWDGTLDSARSSPSPRLSGLQNHSVARAKPLAPRLLRKSRRQTAKVSGLTGSREQLSIQPAFGIGSDRSEHDHCAVRPPGRGKEREHHQPHAGAFALSLSFAARRASFLGAPQLDRAAHDPHLDLGSVPANALHGKLLGSARRQIDCERLGLCWGRAHTAAGAAARIAAAAPIPLRSGTLSVGGPVAPPTSLRHALPRRRVTRLTTTARPLTQSRKQTTPAQRVPQSGMQLSGTDAVPSRPTATRTSTTKENR
jgi:hypothetical protein